MMIIGNVSFKPSVEVDSDRSNHPLNLMKNPAPHRADDLNGVTVFLARASGPLRFDGF
jgi:hypothetical protein